uniref:Uncharacterized protein n=1 Tax=Chelonoidis abingdonii TaxID=106734 RepID=A0A8C0J4T7_CHEAB
GARFQPYLCTYESLFNHEILNVGCGSGILSFFAVQAGARKVYAVEASSVAKYAEVSVLSNNLSDKIMVLSGKIEEISLPENVDVVISEPMGYMLFNERMLESYLHSKKWLKSNGEYASTVCFSQSFFKPKVSHLPLNGAMAAVDWKLHLSHLGQDVPREHKSGMLYAHTLRICMGE